MSKPTGRPKVTHCKAGHEFTSENTIIRIRGKYTERRCKACDAARNKVHAAKMRAATKRKREGWFF